MKVCFVDLGGDEPGLNVGLGYLCSYVERHPAVKELKVFDFNNSKENFDQKIGKIMGFDLVGITMRSANTKNVSKIARKIKNKNKILIVGGIHVTIDGVNFLKENPEFSIGVIGEGEETVLEIIDYILGKKKLQNINGIIYRKGSKIIRNKFRKLNENLDSFHFPNYTYFDSVQESRTHVETYPILTSRSCPFKCSFCICSKVLGEKWRARSVENVIEELIQAKNKYKIKKFSMVDDNWSLDMKRAKKICRKLIEKRLNFDWVPQSGMRADKVDRELLKLMKKSGCSELIFGIESGNKKVFKNIEKGEKLEDIEKAVKHNTFAKEVGMKIGGFFIIGLPN